MLARHGYLLQYMYLGLHPSRSNSASKHYNIIFTLHKARPRRALGPEVGRPHLELPPRAHLGFGRMVVFTDRTTESPRESGAKWQSRMVVQRDHLTGPWQPHLHEVALPLPPHG